jgi:hypothetical protein
MPAGSRHVFRAAAFVLFLALAVPTAALADGGSKCNASACKVYNEQGAPSGGHQKPPTGPNTSGGGQHQQRQQQPPHASKSYSRVLQHLGKDRGPLKNLLGGDAALGNLSGSGGGSPGLLGAAFDLGVGPAILLAILLATGLGLAARGTVQGWLRKRSTS